MRGYCTGDGYRSYSEDEYNDIYQEWLEDGGIEGNGFKNMPCPNEGVWWAEFYERVGQDCETWQRVKKAMERGKCRVVLRWCEYDGPDEDESESGDGDEDGDMDADVGHLGRRGASGKSGRSEMANRAVTKRDRGESSYEVMRRLTRDRATLYHPQDMMSRPFVPRDKTALGRKK